MIRFSSSVPSSLNDFHVSQSGAAQNDGAALGNGSFASVTANVENDQREEGQAIYRRNSDGALVTVAFHLFAPLCELFGTATTTG